MAMSLSLVACGAKTEAPAASGSTPAPEASKPAATIKVAAIETAYGSQVWADVAAAFTAGWPFRPKIFSNIPIVITPPPVAYPSC